MPTCEIKISNSGKKNCGPENYFQRELLEYLHQNVLTNLVISDAGAMAQYRYWCDLEIYVIHIIMVITNPHWVILTHIFSNPIR